MSDSSDEPIQNLTVSALVISAQRGDRGAMGELFIRYRRHVLAIAQRRLGDENEAQELCQEVFLQAIQKLAQLRQPECFGGWLRSIAQRMAINRAVRRPPVIPTEPQTLEATCVEAQTPYATLVEGERASHVHRGLRRLREMDRDTLEAFYMRGKSLIEMSDHFDAPVGTIKRRLHVARKRLAKEVDPWVSV
ncbi:MAG: sigma-70 family RNA polymerase sigma factor [Pirellulaceae bacterium]|nr:sigma-70 family RNA polymerase sigma factor [Pirellulaceae bacterium]